MPQRLSSKQQRWQPQVLQQLDSQPQLFSQPQLCSQPQLFSHPQLCSQPQPQPQPFPPPSRPKNAFALPAEPSIRATASVAKAIRRFIGETPKYGMGTDTGVELWSTEPRGRKQQTHGLLLLAPRPLRRHMLSTPPNC